MTTSLKTKEKNMRTKLTKITLAAGILLAMAFTSSCSMLDDKDEDNSSSSGVGTGTNPSSSSVPGTDPTNPSASSGFSLTSPIYLENCYEDEDNDYELICNPTVYPGNGYIVEDYLGVVGTVTNGRVVSQQLLTKTPPADELVDFVDYYISDYFDCSKRDPISVYRIYRFGLYDDVDEDGYGFGYSGELRVQNEIDESIQYLYAQTAGKIVCTDEDEYSSTSFNLDIQPGWNVVYYKRTYSEEYSEEKLSTSNILTNQVKWVLEEPWYGGF